MIIYFVNIYSSCAIQSKRRLWAELIKLKSFFPSSDWCVRGDFNAIKRITERKFPIFQFNQAEMQEFS